MKNQAIQLRKDGYSLTEICQKLNKAESTVWRWIKHIPQPAVTDRRKSNLITGFAKSRIGRKYPKYQKLRADYAKQGLELFHTNPKFRYLCILYWCEGSKDSKGNTFSFANTDIVMMGHVCSILRELGLIKNPYLYVTCHQDSAADEEIEAFWKQIIPEASRVTLHRKPLQISKKKNRHQHGICKMSIGSTKLITMVLACIEYIQNNESALTTMCAT